MASVNLPRGLIVDLITPLMENCSIDGRGLGRNLDRILPYVQGIFISSPDMGEGITLDSDQREELFDKSLVIIHGKLPILVWITGETEKTTHDNLNLMKKRLEVRKYTGPVFWVDTPLFYHSNRGLHEYYTELCSLVHEPFILYNDPRLIKTTDKSFKRSNIRTSIIKDLASIENIKGLIFCGSLDRSYNYNKAVRSRADFRIFDGDESRFLDHPSRNGLISRGANLVPRAWNKVTVSSLNLSDGESYPDSLQQIWDTWRYLNDLKDIYNQKGVSVIKRVLSSMGIIEHYYSKADKDFEQELGTIIELMKNHGDYS